MSMISLICPHCGGNFELESDRALQSFWICPYCGNRSLMQKNDDQIRLRGIIPNKSPEGTPLHRPLEEIIAEAEGTPIAAPAPVIPITAANPASPAEEVKPEPKPEIKAEIKAAPVAATDDVAVKSPMAPAVDVKEKTLENDLDELCGLAREAAFKHDLPLFNSYSRQAIDCQPDDPRMYALRAVLTEEADGFSRETWTAVFWTQLTPRRKKSILAQHFYTLNAALKYSKPTQQQELIQRIARLIIRQAVDHFTEMAELRCQQNLFFKTFRGRFHRIDLRSAAILIDTLRYLDQSICPLGHLELLAAIRIEISQLPPRIAHRLRRV